MSILLCLGVLLACDAVNSITINPVFTCASSTPRPTDTPFPTSTPDYPWTFVANVDYFNYFMPLGQAYATVTVQYMAQSTGAVQLSYVGYDFGVVVIDSNGYFTIANAPPGQPGLYGTFTVSLPSTMTGGYIDVKDSIQGTIYALYVYPNNTAPGPYNPPPCCLGTPIYPTPVPTYTPYPTPTLYALTNNFYLGDTFYTSGSTARVGVTLTAVNVVWPTPDDMALEWTLTLTNVGPIEYDFYPYFQTYASEVTFSDGSTTDNVWPASLGLAVQLGIPISVLPVPLQPGQTQAFTFVTDGFDLGDRLNKVAFVLNPVQSSSTSPTLVPGSDIVQFFTQPDPFCAVQIVPPTAMAALSTPLALK